MRVTATTRRSRWWDQYREDFAVWRVSPKVVSLSKQEQASGVSMPILALVPSGHGVEYRLTHRGAAWGVRYSEEGLWFFWVQTCCIAPAYEEGPPIHCRTCEKNRTLPDGAWHLPSASGY